MNIKIIPVMFVGLLLFTSVNSDARCRYNLTINGEQPTYTLAYGEERYQWEFHRREASPRKFQWLRNPAANHHAFKRGLKNSWSGANSRHCTVAMATKNYGKYYRLSGNFQLRSPFYRSYVTIDTSEFLTELRRDGDDIRDLVRYLDGSSRASDYDGRYLVGHYPSYYPQARGGLKITYFGTSTLTFEDGQSRILVDGFFSRPNILKLLGPHNGSGGDSTESAYQSFDWGGRKYGNAIDAIIPMHAHHDHLQDIPAILRDLKRDGATTRYLSGRSARNMMRGYARKVLSDTYALESFVPDADDNGMGNGSYRIGEFEISLLKTTHSTVPGIIESLLGLGEELSSPLSPPWRLRDFKEGDGYSALIKHPKGNYLIYLGGRILNTKPLYENGQPIRIDTMFVSAGSNRDKWNAMRSFLHERILPHKTKRVIPVHWDSFSSTASNRYMNADFKYGIRDFSNILRPYSSKTKLMIAPVNTYWHEDHSL